MVQFKFVLSDAEAEDLFDIIRNEANIMDIRILRARWTGIS